jgi:predicted transcriptional regulator
MSQPAATDKQRMIQILEEQPDDSSYDELMRELAFERMVERGVADADAGRTISHEEMGRRVDAWEK